MSGTTGRPPVTVALLVLAALLAVACGWVSLGPTVTPGLVPSSWTAPKDAADREASVLSAARRATKVLFTTDYKTIVDDNKSALEVATGTFKKEFADRADELATVLTEQQMVRTVTIRSIGVSRLGVRTAVVSVAIDTKVSGLADTQVPAAGGKPATTTKKPVSGTAPYRLEMTMQRVGGRWLLGKLDFVV